MAKGRMGRAMTPAVEAARAAGIRFEILEYAHDPSAEAYGTEAAEALHLAPAQVFKTLVVRLDGRTLAVGTVPVAARLDLKALAATLGARKAEMAPPADAEHATGYVVGRSSPLGQMRPLVSALDASPLLHKTVYDNAGRRGAEIARTPAWYGSVARRSRRSPVCEPPRRGRWFTLRRGSLASRADGRHPCVSAVPGGPGGTDDFGGKGRIS